MRIIVVQVHVSIRIVLMLLLLLLLLLKEVVMPVLVQLAICRLLLESAITSSTSGVRG